MSLTKEQRKEQIFDEIELYLSSYKILHTGPHTMSAAERAELEIEGIRSYFEDHPEDWEPLEAWAENPTPGELEGLLVPDLVIKIHSYLQDEMGYEWLTSERVFAYDYSF